MTGIKKSVKPRTKEELLDEAQDLAWDAWDAPDRRTAHALARKALKITADCADAYVILARDARTRAQQFELYQKALAAGERALGEDIFKNKVGNFWGILETRPYMRARQGLAQCLWEHGKDEEALAHWRDMLRLNPGDNQGIRYILIARLLFLNRNEEAADVMEQYRGDGGTYFVWARALLLFRTLGDHPKSRRALDEALATNPHVPTFLFDVKRLPRYLPDHVSWGGQDEAAACVYDLQWPWKSTKGAIGWLAARISAGKPALLN